MALIPILPEDIRVSSVKVHPNQHFISSSISGITGDVFLFAERSNTLKEITPELEEYMFDVKSLLTLDDSGDIIRKDSRKNKKDISGFVNNYITSIGQLAGSLDNDKKLIVYRFDMPHRLNANTMRKSVFVKNLLPFYQGEYERPLSFGFSNYHSLNFFTSSAAFPSNVPSDSAFIYPVPTTSSIDVDGVTRYKPARYFPSASFSFEFYINPRYTTDTSNDHYQPGTILNMPNCYTVSLHSGSHVDEFGRPKSFRLALQLGDYTTRPLNLITLPSNSSSGSNEPELTYVSADNFLQKDRWSYCAIRWGGPKQNNYTGSFYIDGQHAGNITIPNTTLSFGKEKFTDLNNIPSALLVGNRYRCSNQATVSGTTAVDDDDVVTLLTGSLFSPAFDSTKATGKLTVTTTNNSTDAKVTRDIFFVTSSLASLPADTVRVNNISSNIHANTSVSNLISRTRAAFTGALVNNTLAHGAAATAIIDFTKAIPKGNTITLIDSGNNSKAYTSENFNTSVPPNFKSGLTASKSTLAIPNNAADPIADSISGLDDKTFSLIDNHPDGARTAVFQFDSAVAFNHATNNGTTTHANPSSAGNILIGIQGAANKSVLANTIRNVVLARSNAGLISITPNTVTNPDSAGVTGNQQLIFVQDFGGASGDKVVAATAMVTDAAITGFSNFVGGVNISDANSATIAASNLALAINHASGHNGAIVANASSGRLVLTQNVKGTAGNKNIANAISAAASATVPSAFAGGENSENPQLAGLSTSTSGNKVVLSIADHRIDIIPSSSIQISPAQRASGSLGNFLSDMFQISSQNPIYGNSNSTASKTSFLFDSGSANRFGVESLLGDISAGEGVSHTLDFPLNAELQEVRIFSKYRNNTEIKATAKNGYYDFGDKDLLFYLPPYFIPSSSVRQMMSTVTQTHYSSSHTPFNTDLSFGQGGRLINLENFSHDLVTGNQALCYNLSATAPTGTWSNFSADDFDFMPATEAIVLKPENRKRNLSILPSDLGNFKPKFRNLDSRVATLTKQSSVDFFVNDRKEEYAGMINLRNMVDMGQQYNDFSSFSDDNGNPGSLVSRLFPKITVARSVSGEYAGNISEIAHSEVYGQQSKIGLTVLNRTRDPDSNEIMFLDISNIFYGDAIKRESFSISDPLVTGSAGKINLTFKDNGTGMLYRCDASGSHPTWAQAGIILYEEGLACLTNPTIPQFGVNQFSTKFKGDRNLHVLEMRVPISADEARISTNPTYKKLSPSDLPSDRETGCNLITNMFLHDENLNVIGKVNLSRPIVRKDEDRYVFKFKLDF